MKLKVMLEDDAFGLDRAYRFDAGLDIRTPYEVLVRSGESETVNTGVHVAIPNGYVGMLKSKSGLNVKYGIQSEGVIDAGYTGAICVKLFNHGKQDVTFKRGDKISQLVILPIVTPDILVVESLDETERGNNGFGSTGK